MNLTYELSELLNLRRCGAGIPDGFEADAVAAEVMQEWGPSGIPTVLNYGLSRIDYDFASLLIREYGFSCSLDEVREAILARCEKYKREAETGERHD
jgi:hypothetical protein